MTEPFVPTDFNVPVEFTGSGFRLEPLGPQHNERDHRAWMSSIDHIRATPGLEDWSWPQPMTLEENRNDLVEHAADFANRSGFTYSVLDGDQVVGCLYIYPSKVDGVDADVRSWVTEARAGLDGVVWSDVSAWLADRWPFANPRYAERVAP